MSFIEGIAFIPLVVYTNFITMTLLGHTIIMVMVFIVLLLV